MGTFPRISDDVSLNSSGLNSPNSVEVLFEYGVVTVLNAKDNSRVVRCFISDCTVNEANKNEIILKNTMNNVVEVRLGFANNRLYLKWREILRKFQKWSIEDYYETSTAIGKGSEAVVHKATHRESLKHVAFKKMRADHFLSGDEIKLTNKLSHVNLLTPIDVLISRQHAFIVLPLLQGDLHELIVENESLRRNETIIKHIMKGILQGVDYMHQNHFVHGDLKPKNVMINIGCNGNLTDLKIGDFGSACDLSSYPSGIGEEPIVGTLAYVAPEIDFGSGSSVETDSWAIGCTLFELLTGNLLIQLEPGERRSDAIQRKLDLDKQKIKSRLPSGSSENVLSLLVRLLRKIPTERITPSDALRHPWFSNIRNEPL